MSSLPPLVKTTFVSCTPEQAFAFFTGQVHRWWPMATHAIAQSDAVHCEFEPTVGGRVFERTRSGKEHVWGHLLSWEPPQRLAMKWHPGATEQEAQTVEVAFAPLGKGTRVTLTHSGWESLGANAEDIRRNYDRGWNEVLTVRYTNFVSNQPIRA
jgi:uncharacterized protein YndB with AHSA1/START domain